MVIEQVTYRNIMCLENEEYTANHSSPPNNTHPDKPNLFPLSACDHNQLFIPPC